MDAEKIITEEITVTDGKGNDVVISTKYGLSGIWIGPPGGKIPMVAIFMNEQHGPVVGVFGKSQNALAACIYADGNAGLLQLMDAEGKAHTIGVDTEGNLSAQPPAGCDCGCPCHSEM